MALLFRAPLILVFMVTLVSCTPSELSSSEEAYQKAKSEQNLPLIVTNLSKLAQIEPTAYKAKYKEALKASEDLTSAQQAAQSNDSYLAYSLSHQSFRNAPSKV